MTSADLALAILPLLPHAHGRETRAHHYAATIIREADAHGIDPAVVAALIARESGFRADAVSPDGDLGLMQIRRGGAVTGFHLQLTDKALMQVPINVSLGTRYLAESIRACGGDVLRGLTRYKGAGCRASRYARAVMRAAVHIREAIAVEARIEAAWLRAPWTGMNGAHSGGDQTSGGGES